MKKFLLILFLMFSSCSLDWILLEQGNLLDGIFVKGFIQLIVGCAIGIFLAWLLDR